MPKQTSNQLLEMLDPWSSEFGRGFHILGLNGGSCTSNNLLRNCRNYLPICVYCVLCHGAGLARREKSLLMFVTRPGLMGVPGKPVGVQVCWTGLAGAGIGVVAPDHALDATWTEFG